MRKKSATYEARIAGRDQEILRLRGAGFTLTEIGAKFDISRERVRQIITAQGGPTRAEARQAAIAKRRFAIDANAKRIGREIRHIIEDSGPTDVNEIAERIGIERKAVIENWPQDLQHLRLVENTWSDVTWTRESSLEAIRHASIYSFPLTTKAYAELVDIGEVRGPSVARINQIFGTWTAACARAGVESGQTLRGNYQSRWTDEDILQFIRQFLTQPEASNSFNQYDTWRKRHAPDGPSSATIRNRFGSWSKAKRAAFSPERREGQE